MGQLLAYPPVLTCASPRMCQNRVIPLLPLCENQKRSGTCSKRGQRTNSWSSKPMCPTPTTSNALLRTADIRFCHIDVVYNNGGFCVMGELESIPQAEARKKFDVNVRGCHQCCEGGHPILPRCQQTTRWEIVVLHLRGWATPHISLWLLLCKQVRYVRARSPKARS